VLGTRVEVGQKVTLRFCLPISGRVVTMPSTVRWIGHKRNRNAVGLAIDELGLEDRVYIRRFVAFSNGDRVADRERATSGPRIGGAPEAFALARALHR